MSPDGPRLMLHVYLEVPSVQAALADALALLEVLAVPWPLLRCEVQPYWKIPEYQGLTLTFACVQVERDFRALKMAFAHRWLEFPDLDAVWDIREHGPACLLSARWAEVQVLWGTDRADPAGA